MHSFRTRCDFLGCSVQGQKFDFGDFVDSFQLRKFYKLKIGDTFY